MPLAALESLKWTVDLQLQSVPPGIYLLEVVLPATDGMDQKSRGGRRQSG